MEISNINSFLVKQCSFSEQSATNKARTLTAALFSITDLFPSIPASCPYYQITQGAETTAVPPYCTISACR